MKYLLAFLVVLAFAPLAQAETGKIEGKELVSWLKQLGNDAADYSGR